MSFLKRAILHTTRKRGKTLLMFGMLFVMATLILTCFAIQGATETAELNVRESLQGGFTIDAKAANGRLTEDVIASVLALPGVKPEYNARSNAYAEYRAIDGTPLWVQTEGAFDVLEGFEHAGKLMSNVRSSEDSLFTESGFELAEGRHIASGDHGVALVHQAFAKQNNLVVGEPFEIGLNGSMIADGNDTSGTAPVEIVGIFRNSVPQDTSNMLSHLFYENVIFTDPNSYARLFYPSGTVSYDYADFQVSDPAELEAIMSEVKAIPGVDWSACIFTTHDVEYQNAKNALEAMGGMMAVIVAVIVVVSAVLILLILALWVRSRMRETGVLFSMGVSKGNILLQHICEVLMLAVLAFALSFFSSSLIAQKAGDMLLTQASASEYEVVSLLEQDKPAEESQLTEITVAVTPRQLMLLYVTGCAIIMLAVVLSTVPILRMKPKEILTKTS